MRMNMTPDQRLASPGVRLTKTPSGQDCFNPALQLFTPIISQCTIKLWVRLLGTYNSIKRFCLRRDGRVDSLEEAMAASVHVGGTLSDVGMVAKRCQAGEAAFACLTFKVSVKEVMHQSMNALRCEMWAASHAQPNKVVNSRRQQTRR